MIGVESLTSDESKFISITLGGNTINVELFGDRIKADNILKNPDEFADYEKSFTDRKMQNMRSAYLQIVDELRSNPPRSDRVTTMDFFDVEFPIELCKTDEINLDYILTLILEKSKEHDDVEALE